MICYNLTCLIKMLTVIPDLLFFYRMARTKCTARKSTGGKAPTKHLRAFYVRFHILASLFGLLYNNFVSGVVYVILNSIYGFCL